MVQIEILEFLREFNKVKKECFIMRFAKGLETWIKNRLPDSLRDRLNNNKYRYIIKKENLNYWSWWLNRIRNCKTSK